MENSEGEFKSLKKILFLLKCGSTPLVLCFYSLHLLECLYRIVAWEDSPLTQEQYEFLKGLLYTDNFFLLMKTISISSILLFLYSGVFLAIWIYRAAKNSYVLNNQKPGIKPVLALFLLFVPFLNLIAFIPVFSVLINSSFSCEKPKRLLIPLPLIWRCGVFGLAVVVIHFFDVYIKISLESLSEQALLNWEFVGYDLNVIFAPLIFLTLFETMLNLITKLQDEKYLEQNENSVSCSQCGERLSAETVVCPVCGAENEKQALSSPA